MKRFIISILLIFISLTSFSQIKVKEGSFRRIVNYVMDDKDEHMDGNYMPMALIKISTENINAEERNKLYFKGNRATDFHVEPKIGELYLYISAEAATVLEIKHPDYGKTVFTFPEPLCDFCAYELVVVYISNQKEDTAPQNTYLTVSADQDNAIIYIDDEYAGMKEATKSVGIGSTHSWRIECDLYHTENGTVTIEDRESFFIEKQLRQAYGYLSVTTEPESGAIVFIDNKNVGTTPYSSDKMASGTYNVRVVKEMYKTTEQTVTVTDGNTTEAKLSMPANFVNVTIKTDEHSDIYLDNEYKGKGSWSGRLVEGPHYVEARKTSHETSSKNFTVTLGNDLNIDIEAPKPIYGYLDIMTTPLRADVYIDGKNYGKTPKVITDLLVGNHKLRIEKEGCAPLTKDIVIKEGETLSLNETLQTGKEINISTGQSGDKIYIDDEYVGESPLKTNVSCGSHIVKAERGAQTTTKTIEVKVGDAAEEHILAFGKIVTITSSSKGYDVYVDGERKAETPCSLDLSFGKHKIEVKKGERYETKDVEISNNSQTYYHFSPKKEPLNKYLENGVNFITLNGAYSVAPQTSFGITYGQVMDSDIGWFVSAMTNFNFRFSGDDWNNMYNGTESVFFSGNSSSSRFSVVVGAIFMLETSAKPKLKLGLGYGMKVKCWELNGKWYEYPNDTYRGLDCSVGLHCNLRKVTFSIDAVLGFGNNKMNTVELKLGLGFNWKRIK